MTQRSLPRRGTIRPRGLGYQALLRHNGRQLTVGTFPTTDEAQAEIDRWANALAHGLNPLYIAITVDDLMRDYLAYRASAVAEKTARADRTMAGRLGQDITQMRVRDVTRRDIQKQVTRWADELQKASATRYKASLAAFFAWAVDEGARDDNPAHGVRVQPRKHHQQTEINPFSRSELYEVVAEIRAFNPVAADQVLFIALTGVRIEEARELRIRDLHELPYKRLHVSRAHPEGGSIGPTKTKKARFVPLTDEAWQVAKRLGGSKDADDLLICTANGNVIRQKGFRRATRWDDSAKAVWKDEADLVRRPQARREWRPTGRGHRIYDLRHTAATLWLEEGLPLTTVAQWLGHASVTTTARYSHWLGHGADRAALDVLNKRRSDTEVTESRNA